jgi:protease-4
MWLWVLVGGGAFFLFFLAVFGLIYASLRSGQSVEYGGGAFGGDKIGVVDLEGVIIEPKEVVRQLKQFADDDSVKAIILHINTPGGGAAASEEIYKEVLRVRDGDTDRKKKGKRIVASIETLGASGGYYVASATNKIFADQASIVGSIGVIAQWTNYGDLLKWAKLKDEVIKAGALKDVGNPARDMTPEERAYLQSLIDNMHGQFIAAVAAGRKIKVEDLKPIADGRVWTGEQAVGLKLVDQLGDFQTAVYDTARAVGIKGEPSLIRAEKPKRTLLDVLTGTDLSEWIPDRAKLLETNVGFYYLWK